MLWLRLCHGVCWLLQRQNELSNARLKKEEDKKERANRIKKAGQTTTGTKVIILSLHERHVTDTPAAAAIDDDQQLQSEGFEAKKNSRVWSPPTLPRCTSSSAVIQICLDTPDSDKPDDCRATIPCSSIELCNYTQEFMINRTLFVLLTCPVYRDIPVHTIQPMYRSCHPENLLLLPYVQTLVFVITSQYHFNDSDELLGYARTGRVHCTVDSAVLLPTIDDFLEEVQGSSWIARRSSGN